ncbi:DUF3099 domain-containing protein [Streptomyces sp. A7024]|uniref:DUF3099 domain-containing protein n=1 Tax=Streptomyces coryli TaxID=1128680 RepID=A0A6G4TYJ9_9ACTN|nr:DUF3099 domain-containing protein [Streptomyces coryli]NGN64198.1 DUF3099 domain-containing protein [Streptomyces coryli]
MRKRGGTGGSGEVFRITGARKSLDEDVRGRQRRYVISMLIRAAAVVAAALLWNVERFTAIFALILGTFLPYVAVVVANAGRENAPGLPEAFVPKPVQPMLEGRVMDAEETIPDPAEHAGPEETGHTGRTHGAS